MSGKRGRATRAERPKRSVKPLIYAFYEGESEKQYLQQLKARYRDAAVINVVSKPGLFKEAVSQFDKNPSLRENAEVTDEIWFLFDVGDTDGDEKSWDFILPKMKTLRGKRKKPGIRVRLLMTTGCLEYWLLLHFQKCQPRLQCKEERDRAEAELNQICLKNWEKPYEKGDSDIIRRIFETGFETASEYGAWYLQRLEDSGLPTLDNPENPSNAQLDKRYEWLLSCEETFTTVQEAAHFLKGVASLNITG